jgi:hypothetical protein
MKRKIFWLETEVGMREFLCVEKEEDALELIRPIYNTADESDEEPTQWLVRRTPEDEEDYVLVPGGPAGEEFTWMPRSMWIEGGPLGPMLSDAPNKCPNCLGFKRIATPVKDGLHAIDCPECEGTGIRKHT